MDAIDSRRETYVTFGAVRWDILIFDLVFADKLVTRVHVNTCLVINDQEMAISLFNLVAGTKFRGIDRNAIAIEIGHVKPMNHSFFMLLRAQSRKRFLFYPCNTSDVCCFLPLFHGVVRLTRFNLFAIDFHLFFIMKIFSVNKGQ